MAYIEKNDIKYREKILTDFLNETICFSFVACSFFKEVMSGDDLCSFYVKNEIFLKDLKIHWFTNYEKEFDVNIRLIFIKKLNNGIIKYIKYYNNDITVNYSKMNDKIKELDLYDKPWSKQDYITLKIIG